MHSGDILWSNDVTFQLQLVISGISKNIITMHFGIMRLQYKFIRNCYACLFYYCWALTQRIAVKISLSLDYTKPFRKMSITINTVFNITVNTILEKILYTWYLWWCIDHLTNDQCVVNKGTWNSLRHHPDESKRAQIIWWMKRGITEKSSATCFNFYIKHITSSTGSEHKLRGAESSKMDVFPWHTELLTDMSRCCSNSSLTF